MHQSIICVVNLKITRATTGKEHILNVTAQSGNFIIFRVDIADFITHTHTWDQWKLFAKYANQYGAGFWVVFPNGSNSDARSKLNQPGIQAKTLEL
jgi:hypothetical protein